MSEHEPSVKRTRTNKTAIILGILLVISLGGCGAMYWQYTKASNKDPQAQQKRWISELNKVIVTPDEEPIVTTVLDKSKLTNQTLAAQAANGDRLYIYSKAKRLVLYRPDAHKVVDMLTIQTSDADSPTATSPKP